VLEKQRSRRIPARVRSRRAARSEPARNSTPISRRFGWLLLGARPEALTAQALSSAAPLFSTAGACSAHAAELLARRAPLWVLLSSAGPMVGPLRAALCSRSDAGAANARAACKARRARSAAEKAAAQALLLQDATARVCGRSCVEGKRREHVRSTWRCAAQCQSRLQPRDAHKARFNRSAWA
jgi:hypothetical protein